jgi:hypothetical protein
MPLVFGHQLTSLSSVSLLQSIELQNPTAQAENLLALDGSQDFRLGVEVHVAYLIQQYCAALSQFELSSLRSCGAGKSPRS